MSTIKHVVSRGWSQSDKKLVIDAIKINNVNIPELSCRLKRHAWEIEREIINYCSKTGLDATKYVSCEKINRLGEGNEGTVVVEKIKQEKELLQLKIMHSIITEMSSKIKFLTDEITTIKKIMVSNSLDHKTPISQFEAVVPPDSTRSIPDGQVMKTTDIELPKDQTVITLSDDEELSAAIKLSLGCT